LLDGQFGMATKARALTYMSSDQWARLGSKLNIADLTGEVPQSVIDIAKTHVADMAENGSKHDQAIAAHMLKQVQKGDMSAMAGFGRTRVGQAMSDQLAHVAGWYHTALAKQIPEDQLAHADELYDVLPQMAHNFGSATVAEEFDPNGAKAVRDITEAGLQPARIEYKLAAGDHPLIKGSGKGSGTVYRRTGFTSQGTDHSIGQARYINALGQRVTGQPLVAKAAIEALRDPFARKIRHRFSSLVHFDPRDDPLLFQRFDESSAVASLLSNRFIKQNYATDKFACTGRGKQKFTIRAPVLLRRSDIDAFQSLLDRPRTFIGCQDSLPRRDQLSCYGLQIFTFHCSLLMNHFSLLSTNYN